MKKKLIVEKKLGIPADYQYKALRSNNFLQSNWHNNKLIAQDLILKMTGAKTVLDLGCGSGNFELTFANRLKNITACDYNDEAIAFLKNKLAKGKIKNVDTLVSNLTEIAKENALGKFDLIVMTDVIEHLKMPDAEKLIGNFEKFLEKDGYVCIITPNYHSPWYIIEILLDKFSVVPHFDGEQHLAKFYKENLERKFRSKGYKTIYFGTFNLLSHIFPSKRVSAKLAEVELLIPMNFGNLLVALFTKKAN